MSDFKLTSYVPAAIKGNAKGTKAGMIVIANKIVNKAKSNAQFSEGYQTGQTRAGIMWKSKTDSGGFGGKGETPLSLSPSADEVVVGVNNDHALYVEYGTRDMPAQPYLRPAISSITNGTTAKKALADAMYDSVQEYLKRAGSK